MRSHTTSRFLRRLCWAAALSATVSVGLSACGGGDGGGGEPPGSINISTANRVPVTRAVIASAMSGAVGASLGLAAGDQPTAWTSRALPRALLRALRGGDTATRETRAAIVGPETVPCDVSGSMTLTLDDRNDDGVPSVGDVLSATLDNCSDMAGESVNGAMSATYTQIVLSPLTVGASVTVSALRMADGPRSAQLDGNFGFTLTEASASVVTLNTVVAGSLAMSVATPAFTDTVTLLDGYAIVSTEDLSAVPPGGGTPGRTTTTVSGKLTSAAAGGTVQVSTSAPFVQYSDDPYPRSGTIGALGKTGWAEATVLSTSQVRIDIDSTGDGVVDDTVTLPWTDLL